MPPLHILQEVHHCRLKVCSWVGVYVPPLQHAEYPPVAKMLEHRYEGSM